MPTCRAITSSAGEKSKRILMQIATKFLRRFGWDTHGLPVEFEIDKKLNIKGPDDVAKMGIAAYNDECRKIVMRYAGDWEEIIGRMGRWIGE
jgi:isoleucyl-tRNA synthetase